MNVLAESIALDKRFFHWFLEFPQVFASGGFDCVLGNPPFLGGQKLSGTFGKAYPEYLKHTFSPIGSCDLVTFFFRRIFGILKKNGFQSLIATNTIAQGAAREGGVGCDFGSGRFYQPCGAVHACGRGWLLWKLRWSRFLKGKWMKKFVLDPKTGWNESRHISMTQSYWAIHTRSNKTKTRVSRVPLSCEKDLF